MNIVETSLQSADAYLATGVRLRYVEQGDPTGHPIILLHGYTDSSFSFSRAMSRLPETYHVYALDQRGHGDSERPSGGYKVSDFAADVVAFMDALRLERATIVGHCMGSVIAQRVALDAPQRVEGLVLVSSMTTPRNIEDIFALELAIEAFHGWVPAEFAREFQESTVYQPLPGEFMDRIVSESLKLPARVWRATLAGLLEEEDKSPLSQIRIPTLILWGERDSMLKRAEQDALIAALGNSIFKAYPETGHSPHWERPEQFVRDLEAFICKVETG